jgi:CheY-like chemotaxis protein
VKKKKKILVVEDEAMIAEAMSDIIEILGHEVIWFESGIEALRMSSGVHFDLAVIDLELPAMPGLEVAERLLERQPDVRIIYSTGYSEQEEQIDLSHPHVAGIIHKPFEMADLQRAVENALSKP